MSNVDDTLGERKTRYGIFADGADCWLDLQERCQAMPGWQRMKPDQRYTVTMILMKLARALNGDPHDTDNWHDIQGYAKLVEDRILGRGIYAGANKKLEDVQRAEPTCTCPAKSNAPETIHSLTCARAPRRSTGG